MEEMLVPETVNEEILNESIANIVSDQTAAEAAPAEDQVLENETLLSEEEDYIFDMDFVDDSIAAAPIDETSNFTVLTAERVSSNLTGEDLDGIIYDVRINSVDYTMVIPRSDDVSLCTIDGYLYNMGSSTVVGRVYRYNESISSTSNPTFVTFYPVNGNGGVNNFVRYGNYSKITAYTLTGSNYQSVSGTDTYASVSVLSEPKAFSTLSASSKLFLCVFALAVTGVIMHKFLKGGM